MAGTCEHHYCECRDVSRDNEKEAGSTSVIEIKTLWDTTLKIPSPFPKDGENEEHFVLRFQRAFIAFIRKHKVATRRTVIGLCTITYFIYLAVSIHLDIELAKPLIICTVCFILILIYLFVRDNTGKYIYKAIIEPADCYIEKHWSWIKCIVYAALTCGVTSYLVLAVFTSWRQVQSMFGMVLFLFIPWATCKHPTKIKWRPVIWGLGMQFVIGILVLRWTPGYNAVKWLSNKINTIIFYSISGAAGAFGDPTLFLHPFLMLVVPLVIYVGVVISLCYHFGWIQKFASKLGWLVDNTMQTTAIESVSIAVNIFLSVLDTVIMLKPYLTKLTPSEFHCFLVGAHSTIAGFAFGLFVLFGVKPQHILTGAVMSAPAAIAVAKLNWPEVHESVFKVGHTDFELGTGGFNNVFDALAKGAWEAGKSGLTILLQVLVFMALLIFLDDVIYWFGAKIGLELSLGLIFSFMFYPLAYVIGVDREDLSEVSNLLGLKLVANEFLGFIKLGQYGREGVISQRSQALATYAMCGFSSFGTLVIFTGVWNTVSPTKTREAVKLIPRIMMNANIACFLTACIAGMFYNEDIVEDDDDPPRALLVMLNILQAIPGYKELTTKLQITT